MNKLLSDEIDHGRIGWAHLASLSPAERAEVAPWLLPMAFVNLRQWRRESPAGTGHTPALAEHGAPAASVIHAALVDALTSLILPGLRQLGMRTGALEQWLADGATTERAPVELLGDE